MIAVLIYGVFTWFAVGMCAAICGNYGRSTLKNVLIAAGLLLGWPILFPIWITRSFLCYMRNKFMSELRDLLPRDKPESLPRSPQALGLWD